jgi:hypothetical protein
VLASAADDPVARSILDRLADEVVALVRVALKRLDLTATPVEVLLGGGLTRAAGGCLIGAVQERLDEIAPQTTVHATSSPPIVGAALLGLDAIGAGPTAKARARAELDAAVAELSTAVVERLR